MTDPELPDEVIQAWMQTPGEESIAVEDMSPDDVLDAEKDFQQGSSFFLALAEDIAISCHFHPGLPVMAVSDKFGTALDTMDRRNLMAIIAAAAWDAARTSGEEMIMAVKEENPEEYEYLKKMHEECGVTTPQF